MPVAKDALYCQLTSVFLPTFAYPMHNDAQRARPRDLNLVGHSSPCPCSCSVYSSGVSPFGYRRFTHPDASVAPNN